MTDRSRNLHLDLHALQSYPFSSLNRGRFGEPKHATYGGTLRSRVSSQNTDRTLRMSVEEQLGEMALRSTRFPELIALQLAERGWPADEAAAAGRMLIEAASVEGLTVGRDGTSNEMLFLPDTAPAAFADIAERHRSAFAEASAAAAKASASAGKKTEADDHGTESLPALAAKAVPAKEVRAVLATRNASITAFGRMLADEPGSEIRGAIRTAHSLTTHEMQPEVDFFTAVDDAQRLNGDRHGAAHLGDQTYDSGTFYRYSSQHITRLLDGMNHDWENTGRKVVEAYVRAFALEPPNAKAGSTAPFTVPHVLYIAVRTDRPVNLVGAYEKAVPASADGYLPESIRRLNTHAAAIHGFLGTGGLAGHAHGGLVADELPALGPLINPVEELVDWTVETISEALP
ncbi:type I-E CRISPR-associated protein Cas7/Cse4/CasC [Kitasatospora sp. NPDC059795]|uniref:type I-E CRISPR-associated protein Cas7/Cse4/CasC n=1 Tax=Kitasatospora sp. NPDC059795 TaxID=3346949 RepID=UPI003646993A